MGGVYHQVRTGTTLGLPNPNIQVECIGPETNEPELR